jgi:hypothetical protein
VDTGLVGTEAHTIFGAVFINNNNNNKKKTTTTTKTKLLVQN